MYHYLHYVFIFALFESKFFLMQCKSPTARNQRIYGTFKCGKMCKMKENERGRWGLVPTVPNPIRGMCGF